jgi:NADH-quinone oxidoreductase subunit E
MALDDATRDELRAIIDRYPRPRSALLPMLHLVQSEVGHVSSEGVELCAELLGITTAEVAAVVSFYSMYKRHPVGRYHVGVCTNTLCAVMGGDAIFEGLKEHLGVGNDETTPDGMVTLEHVECNAACDYAPVVMVNWEFFDNQTVQGARELVDRLRDGEPVTSTRGPQVRSFREVERVLAGFPDGLAGEGPAAGPATLVGLALARERGEHPDSPADRGAEPAPADDVSTEAASTETASIETASGETASTETASSETASTEEA